MRFGLVKDGAGAAATSLSLSVGFGGGQLELLLGEGNSLPLAEPSLIPLLLLWCEPLLLRAAAELGPY